MGSVSPPPSKKQSDRVRPGVAVLTIAGFEQTIISPERCISWHIEQLWCRRLLSAENVGLLIRMPWFRKKTSSGRSASCRPAATTSGEEEVVAPAALIQSVSTPAALPAPAQPVPAPEQLPATPAQRSTPVPAHTPVCLSFLAASTAALRFGLRTSLVNP